MTGNQQAVFTHAGNTATTAITREHSPAKEVLFYTFSNKCLAHLAGKVRKRKIVIRLIFKLEPYVTIIF